MNRKILHKGKCLCIKDTKHHKKDESRSFFITDHGDCMVSIRDTEDSGFMGYSIDELNECFSITSIDPLTTSELIFLLKGEKAILEREENGEILYLFSGGGIVETRGWGSAYTRGNEAIIDLYYNPEKWRVSEHTMDKQPFPWSVKFKNGK